MNTSSTRGARLNRRAKILLIVVGVVVIIVLVAVALLAFDRPLLARLTGSLPGEVIGGGDEKWAPEGFEFCAQQGWWNNCWPENICKANGDVLYGVQGSFYTKTGVSGWICCNDASIGYDPAVGQSKNCYRRRQ